MGYKMIRSLGLIVIFLLCFSCAAAATQPDGASQEPAGHVATADSLSGAAPDSFSDQLTDMIQEIQIAYTPFGNRETPSVHLKPGWQWDRLTIQFDLGFYYNPWRECWQWGRPDPAQNPEIPNFIDTMTYYGRNFELDYRKITDLQYGYGLLLYGYHPANPYRGFQFSDQLWPEAHLTITAPAEVHYLLPYTLDPAATLMTARFEDEATLLGIPWRLGITEIQEGNGYLRQNGYPQQALGFDLAMTKNPELVPFLESARLAQGGGLMAGLSGRITIFNYVAGYFRTDGQFLPNYFGGRYEDQKANTLGGWGDALPNLGSGAFPVRDGWVGGMGVAVGDFLNCQLFYLDDAHVGQQILGLNFTGELKPLRLKYGFANYGMAGDFWRYDWYIKGSGGIWDYSYHHYYGTEMSQEEFKVSVRL